MAITINPKKDLQQALDSFKNPVNRSDIAKALSKTAQNTKTKAFNAALSEFAINRSAIKGRIFASRASKKGLEARVDARSTRFNLGKFNFTGGVGQSGQIKPRIKIKIRKKSPFEELKRAFVWRGIIMERQGFKRYGLKDMQSLSLPQMLNNPTVRMEVENFAAHDLSKRLIGIL